MRIMLSKLDMHRHELIAEYDLATSGPATELSNCLLFVAYDLVLDVLSLRRLREKYVDVLDEQKNRTTSDVLPAACSKTKLSECALHGT